MRHQVFNMPMGFVSPNAPGIAQDAAGTGRQMPEPAPIAIAKYSPQYMKNGAGESDAIKRSQPERNWRMFFHPVRLGFFLHAQKMHRGATALFNKHPKGLDIIMMNSASADA